MRKLLGALLVLAAVPVLAINALPEVPISPAEVAPIRGASEGRIATNGELYVAAWTDLRSGQATYAARLRADGTLLDPLGIRIAPNSQLGAVIWSGSAFLIAYLEQGMVKVRALSPDGVLGDPIDMFANYVLPQTYFMKMAANGDSVLLVTSEANGAILGPDGHQRRKLTFPWLFAQRGFGVATAGTTYLVAAGTHDELLKTQIVTADGDFGASTTQAENIWGGLDVASDGNRFLVVWARDNAAHAQFVTREGALVEPKIALTDQQAQGLAVTRLVRRGDEYLFAYRTSSRDQTLLLGNDGEKRGTIPISLPGAISDVVFPYGGLGAVIGFDEVPILSVAFFDGGVLREPAHVPISGKRQTDVRLASVTGGIVTAWTFREYPQFEVWLSRGPGSTPVVVARVDEPFNRARLIDAVVQDDTIWVVWIGEQDFLYVRRYTLALQPIDSTPVLIHDDSLEDVSVAAGGGTIAIVRNEPLWSGLEPPPPHVVVHVLRGIGSGIEKKTTAVASIDGYDRLPSIAWNGNVYVIAWANALGFWYPSEYKLDDRIVMMHMTASGELLDANPIEIARSAHIDALGVANGAVAWQTYQTPDHLTARRHTYAACAIADATVVDLGGEDTFFGAFTADTNGFLLVRAKTDDSSTVVLELLTLDANLAVTSATELRPISAEPLGYPLTLTFDADVIPGAIAYSRLTGEDYGHNRRIFVRRLADMRRRALRLTR